MLYGHILPFFHKEHGTILYNYLIEILYTFFSYIVLK
jgi:hypothetical protein